MEKIATLLLIALGWSGVALGQSYKETKNMELTFEKPAPNNVFMLANVNGNITAEGYEGDKIIIEAVKRVTAKSEERLEMSKTELNLGVRDLLDSIIVYIDGPCMTFDDGVSAKRWMKGWNYHGNSCHEKYNYSYDFILKIPNNLTVHLSTINDGNIEIKGLSGIAEVVNVNGSITMTNMAGETHGHTVNGDVTVEYSQQPEKPSSYYTLNGDINALYPPGLMADISFKSYNGEFFTNIDPVEHQQAQVKREQSTDDGINYKVDIRSTISVRGGGVKLDFETFNGNVIVKEN